MLLHVFVKKMYSHKQSIEQKYYVRVEYALKNHIIIKGLAFPKFLEQVKTPIPVFP
mgnify:CR=1 FL=1